MTQRASNQYELWEEKSETFSSFHISPIRHNFQSHPLMQLPRLAQLAKMLFDKQQCRFIKPGVAQSAAFHHEGRPSDGRDIDEVFARISDAGSWIALYNIETDPEYREFLHAVVDAGRHLVEKRQSGIHSVQGFLFISAPPSFTPFHIDRENNLWLQMQGRKVMSVWDHRDRQTVAASDVERFIMTGGLSNVTLLSANRKRAYDFEVVGGTGVYFPSTSPHMTATEVVASDAENIVSISVGVVFYTDQTRCTANVHILNHYLRRMGLHPTFAGQSSLIDSIKYPLARLLVRGLRWFRGFRPKPGIVPGS